MTEARLRWAERLNAIAQNGLYFEATPVHDRRRYEQVRSIAAEMLAGHMWHIWRVFVLCELEREEQATFDHESAGAAFFSRTGLPALSLARVTEQQVARLFEHRENPGWPADFD